MFNDPLAHEAFQKFQAQYRFGTIVETGTNLGKGALHCSLYRGQVCTIEVNASFRNQAVLNMQQNGYQIAQVTSGERHDEIVLIKSRVEGIRAIFSYLGSSEKVMDWLLTQNRFPRPYLFYLDAHWENYWPLLDELKVIAKHGLSDSCIIIHDFQVPGQPTFGFDVYKGQPLNIDYIRQDLFAINPNYVTFYNEKVTPGPSGRGIFYAVPPS